MQLLEAVMQTSRKVGPYVMLELLLPGGTLFALGLFLYRHPAKWRTYARNARNATVRAFAEARRALGQRNGRTRSLATGIETTLRAMG